MPFTAAEVLATQVLGPVPGRATVQLAAALVPDCRRACREAGVGDMPVVDAVLGDIGVVAVAGSCLAEEPGGVVETARRSGCGSQRSAVRRGRRRGAGELVPGGVLAEQALVAGFGRCRRAGAGTTARTADALVSFGECAAGHEQVTQVRGDP